MQSAQAPLFIAYFFAGVAVGANGVERGLLDADGMLARRWRLWLGLAAAAFFALARRHRAHRGKQSAARGRGAPCQRPVRGFKRNGLRGPDRALLALRNQVPVPDSLARNAYGIYLVHYFFVIWLQYLMLGVGVFAVAKGIFVSAASLLLSWATAIAFSRMPPAAGPALHAGILRQRPQWPCSPFERDRPAG